MSTRATYQFISPEATTTCYIHYDGYPEGAAVYFRNMLTCENKRGGYATRFIHSNDLAEITGSHNSHGDTEYRYTVANEMVTVEEVNRDDWETWRTIAKMPLIDFVNKHRDEHEKPLFAFGHLVMTESDAIDYIKGKMSEMWMLKGRGHTGNASGMMSDIIRIIKQIRESIPTFGEYFIADCRCACLDFGKSCRWEKPEDFEKKFIDEELAK